MSTDLVSEFYTRHPYPPPVDNLDRARASWSAARERAEFHLFWPRQAFRAELDILVAGCGTWQAAKYALCRRAAHVTGIDVSDTSIGHTLRLREKYQLDNLDVRQLPLERAGTLAKRYDLVVCTGVLHHLADPEAGLRALRGVLKPGGAMYLMVYAPYGRAGIYLLQDYCRRLGVGSTDQDVRELAATLAALPAQHPLAATLRGSRDAFDRDALADALLNPRERAYAVAQLLDLLSRHHFAFGRWHCQAPYLPSCGAIAATPHAVRLNGLPVREQYAAMELWRGTMSCHSVIAYAGEEGARAQRVPLDGSTWQLCVPHKLPWSELTRERPPPGADGVLVNRNHAYGDLRLALRATDRRMFEHIDGHRSIAEIAAAAGALDLARVAAFFDSLWRHDHVSFAA